MYDDDEEEIPARRSLLVPILAIVAGLLAIAVAVVIVLFAMGFFDRGARIEPASTGDAPALTAPAADAAAEQPPAPDVSEIDVPGAGTDVPRAVVSVAPPGQGEPPVRSTHGDWQVRCDTPAGAQDEQCVLMQFVTAEDRDNVGLTVIVLKTADGSSQIMRVLAPLGVLLPSGLGLKIDQTDLGRAGFVRCLPNGCVAEVILEEPLFEQLTKGQTATYIIFQTPEEGIGIPISLNGFSEGYAALP